MTDPMNEFEQDFESFAELEAQYKKEMAEIELAEQRTEETEEEKKTKEAARALRKALEAEQARLKALEDERYEQRKKLVERKKTANFIRQKMLLAQDRERVRAAAEEFAHTIDEITKDCVWRTGDEEKGIYKAFQHQIDGMHFLAAAKKAILADEMGLGKTGQSIMATQALKSKRTLIICPGDVMMNFDNEFGKWAPDVAVARIGRMPKDLQKSILDMLNLANVEPTVVLLNYESWARNKALLDWLIDFRFDTIILDEAHKMKEADKQTFKGVDKVVMAENSCPDCGAGIHLETVNAYSEAYKCNRCVWRQDNLYGGSFDRTTLRSIKNVICMTGTPILNSPDEIYAPLHMIRPEIFPTKARFLATFCTTLSDGKIVWNWGGQDRLVKQISGMYLRRTKQTAGIVLPPQTVIKHEIEMDADLYPKQMKLLRMLVRNAQIEISEGRAASVAAKITLILRQRQAVAWPGDIKIRQNVLDEKGRPKYVLNEKTDEYEIETELVNVGHLYAESIVMDRAIDMAEEFIANGERVVIASQFTSALNEAKRRLGDKAVLLVGGMTPEQKDPIKRNFDVSYKEPKKWDAICMNYKTGGVGLNLTAATQTIFLDQEWNPGNQDQAAGRTWRIGQREETTVHILHLEKSISKWMDNLIETKRKMIDGFETAAGIGQMIDDVFKDMEI
jgi:SNF2 family DNA or RNA helicase